MLVCISKQRHSSLTKVTDAARVNPTVQMKIRSCLVGSLTKVYLLALVPALDLS